MKTLITLALLVSACSVSERLQPATGGDPQAGKETIVRYGCGACHAIEGIPGFRGQVAPPLTGLANRAFIAGSLPNTPINLVRWIREPHEIEKHTAMPTLGLTEKEARDVAAYLYTLD